MGLTPTPKKNQTTAKKCKFEGFSHGFFRHTRKSFIAVFYPQCSPDLAPHSTFGNKNWEKCIDPYGELHRCDSTMYRSNLILASDPDIYFFNVLTKNVNKV